MIQFFDLQKSYENSVELKTLGNAKFAKGEFATALEDYTSAIDACPEGPDYNKHKSVLHSNRAATFLKLEIKENYETAVADCSTGRLGR
jgi:tetratricopeptide (TPR) repeat protein